MGDGRERSQEEEMKRRRVCRGGRKLELGKWRREKRKKTGR